MLYLIKYVAMYEYACICYTYTHIYSYIYLYVRFYTYSYKKDCSINYFLVISLVSVRKKYCLPKINFGDCTFHARISI